MKFVEEVVSVVIAWVFIESELHLTNDLLIEDEVDGDVLKLLNFLLHIYYSDIWRFLEMLVSLKKLADISRYGAPD